MEFPGKFQKKTLEFWNSLENSKKKTLEFWNFRGNSKIPKFFLEFPRKFQNSNNFSQNSKTSSKKLWNFGILEFSRKFQNSKVFFWNFRGNSKIPKFLLEFQNIFQKTLEFWNFGISQEKSSLCGQAICLSCLLITAHLFCYPKVGLWTVAWHSGKDSSVWTSYLSFLSSDYSPPLLLP